MTEQRARRVRALFDEAVDLPPQDQAALLDASCPGDPDLRARVAYLLACDALLRNREGAGESLDRPLIRPPRKVPLSPGQPGPTVWPSTEVPGPAESPAAAAALPARLGRYEVLEVIGRGGMGCVLRGHDPELRRDLAVKVLLPDHQHDRVMRSRFTEEAQIAGRLQHPGVVPVHELGRVTDGRPFIAMKLVKGRTLADLLQERANPADNLPHFLAIFEAVCQTVAYAHSQNVIHRDLKPANVMVGAFGEVQVMDWGLAKVLRPPHSLAPALEQGEGGPEISPAPLSRPGQGAGGEGSPPGRTQPGEVLGTPAYMAPEQAWGAPDRLDERCDVFGLGAMLCEVLTGGPPYTGAGEFQLLYRAAQADL
jgi:serine/threonine-protein kinase